VSHHVPPPLSLALTHLRVARGWTQQELAAAAGARKSLISDYEKGRRKTLSIETLRDFLVLMGYQPEDINLALLFQAALSGTDGDEHARLSPAEPSARELRLASRLGAQAGLRQATHVRARLLELARFRRVSREREAASDLWRRLRQCKASEQLDLIERSREFHTWALAERLCDESEGAASDSAQEARRLAELALRVAELVPGQGAWNSQLLAYCWAFVANADRVAGELPAANRGFATAWRHWHEQGAAMHCPFSEWRLYDLESSLRRAQRDFSTALVCIDRAQAMAPSEAQGRILLKKQLLLEKAGDYESALAVLELARPLVDLGGDLRHRRILCFNFIVLLCQLHRYEEAESKLPELRRLAVEGRASLDLTRVLWLSGRVAAGCGRREEACAAFEQVRHDFATRGMACDTALVSFELALLYLHEGRSADVARLAEEMIRTFRRVRANCEVLAAVRLLFEAAQSGTATISLIRNSIDRVERSRFDPILAPKEQVQNAR
jgi:tetratricopeptide (TPR) repeat protein